jgi:cytochrome c
VRLWDLEAGVEIVSLPGHEKPIFGVAISADGRFAASGGADHTVMVWNLETRTFVRALYGHRGPVWSLAFTPDGRRLLSAGSDEVVRVWDLATGEEIGTDGSRRLVVGPVVPEIEGAERGAALFRRCAVCHSLTANGPKRAGPTLFGVFGRRAGTVAGYKYSDALKNSKVVWSEATIDALFAKGPHIYTPGSKMPIQRMPGDDDREELIAYLKRATAPGR